MSEIFVDDKVKTEYAIFVGVKADEDDMRTVSNEFADYKKIGEISYNDDVILVYASS